VRLVVLDGEGRSFAFVFYPCGDPTDRAVGRIAQFSLPLQASWALIENDGVVAERYRRNGHPDLVFRGSGKVLR
jgi:hypothetical protein